MTITRYTKAGTGSRLGDSWMEARPVEMLNEDLRQALAGDEFLIGFDRNREDPIFWSRTGVTIEESGAENAPLVIKAGYVSHVDDVQLAGPNREYFFRRSGSAGETLATPDVSGPPFILLDNGASFLQLSGFALFGAPASGFIQIGRDRSARNFSGIGIRGLNVARAGRVIETGTAVSVRSLLVEDCTATELVRGFARFRNLSNATFRNLVLDAGYADGGGGNVCQLIHVDAGSQLLFENIWMRDAFNGIDAEERGSPYVQGDGIVCEEETRDIVVRNCHATGMGDGGFDLKTVNVVFEDGSAHGCKKGIRIWSRGDNLIRRSLVTGPRSAGGHRGSCVWCSGIVDVVDTSLQAGSGSSIFAFGESNSGLPQIRMFGGQIRMDDDAALIMERSGTLELHDVAVNGSIRNETIQSPGGAIK